MKELPNNYQEYLKWRVSGLSIDSIKDLCESNIYSHRSLDRWIQRNLGWMISNKLITIYRITKRPDDEIDSIEFELGTDEYLFFNSDPGFVELVREIDNGNVPVKGDIDELLTS